MQNSACLIFPFEYDDQNECLKRAFTVEGAIVSSIKAFLITRRGSRVGSNIGSFLSELLLKGIPTTQLTNLSNELKTELESQFAGVNFLDVLLTRDLTKDVSTLLVNIKLSIPSTGEFDFSISLSSSFTN